MKLVRTPELKPFIVYFRPPTADFMKQQWIPKKMIRVSELRDDKINAFCCCLHCTIIYLVGSLLLVYSYGNVATHNTYTHVHTHTHAHTSHTHTHVHTSHTYAHTHTCMHTHAHTHAHTYTTHAHTHTHSLPQHALKDFIIAI